MLISHQVSYWQGYNKWVLLVTDHFSTDYRLYSKNTWMEEKLPKCGIRRPNPLLKILATHKRIVMKESFQMLKNWSSYTKRDLEWIKHQRVIVKKTKKNKLQMQRINKVLQMPIRNDPPRIWKEKRAVPAFRRWTALIHNLFWINYLFRWAQQLTFGLRRRSHPRLRQIEPIL